jgi:hypothetical protein
MPTPAEPKRPARPRPPPPRPAGGKAARFFGAVVLVAMVAVIAFVIHHANLPSDTAPRPAFDPETTDRAELRRVTEAVSRVIAAPPDQHEAAVQTLESVRATSPGALDLEEACVNTYRGMIRAQALLAQITAIEGDPDGGLRGAAEIPPQDRARALDLHRQTSEQIELVEGSKDRCHDLYAAAVHQLGLAPAERWHR